MKNFSIKIDDKLKNKIDLYAKEKGINNSSLVREALEKYFESKESKSHGSFASLAKDLSGSLEGPTDLSSNDKYLQGFGK